MDLTYLFVPGISERKISKSFSSMANVIIIDLEDAVTISRKDEARHIVYNMLINKTEKLNKTFIRINSYLSPWFREDLRLVSDLSIDGVIIPKCEDASTIKNTMNLIDKQLEIIPLIESASGVHNVKSIIRSSNQIDKVAFGAVDYAIDLGVDWTPKGEERRLAMQKLVLASRTCGISSPIDAVFPILNNQDEFKLDANYGKGIGFYGKMVIHPNHVQWVNEVYKPTEQQLKWSKKVVNIYENGENSGAVELDGNLIDYPIYSQAIRILSYYDK
ncbi:HpcH/HpaI aldolase/citrate lyase family protein [Virgibacillus litoralis]|uniref:Citrate lyase subunit beta/citryl-CoA lyase n=1 Tax=Virgibacillus litoralis TaxID=578221 RepID=A0ABS4H856_9BACI|nr:CoA ester lyase [Virgibacillus litoralis]MBP1947090.1 citrate lyase subunit beta/citryl-CoA lyase [Virgibacillus litoralis]